MAIPDSDDHEYHMLISNTGAYKTPFIIDKQAGTTVLPGYTEKVWNQTGPAGAPGAPGAAGEPGPQGEPGISGSSDLYVKRFELNEDVTVIGHKDYQLVGDSEADMVVSGGWLLYPDSDPFSLSSGFQPNFSILGGGTLSTGEDFNYKYIVQLILNNQTSTEVLTRFVHISLFGVFAKITP